MDFKNSIIEFWGSCTVKSALTLDELAKIISPVLCGGLPFTYGKHSIWEEIPSMYVEHSILGSLIIIGGYGGEQGFEVAIWPYGNYTRYINEYNLKDKTVKIKLDFHLYHLLKQGLSPYPDILIIEPLSN
jgi:hypothetical protein